MTNEQGKLGTLECIMILTGGMIGAAIFSLSGLTYAMAGAASIISWIIGGGILLLYGMQTAELCTIYPQSGGMFAFPYEALGKKRVSKEAWGWLAAWSLLNVNIFCAGSSAMYVSSYLGQSFPALANYTVAIAVIWSVVCTLLCLFNITVAGRVNLVLTLALVALMLLYAVIGFTSGKFDPANYTPFFSRGSLGATGFVSAIPIAMLAYNAIVSVAFMMNQVKNPKKTVPQSMIIAMVFTLICYVLVIVSTIGLLAVEAFQDPTAAWMQYVPLYAVAWFVLNNLPWLHYVITIAAVLALTTTMLVVIMTSGWTVQAAADKGLLPKSLAKVNEKTGTPVAAMALVGIVTTVVACFPGFISEVINCGAMTGAIAVVIIALTLLAARKQHTYVPGDFRLGGGAALPIITIALVVFFILPGLFQACRYWGLTLGWYAVGLVIFLLCQIGAKNRTIG